LRLVIVILLFVGFAFATSPNTTSKITDSNIHKSSISQSTTDSSKIATSISDDNVCYYDWKWYTTAHIGEYNTAPAGSTYAVVTIYIKNKGDKSASTNPLDWYLLIDGLKYTYDLATYDSSINHLIYDVMKGAETETTIAYLVKGYPQHAELKYDKWFGPELKHIDHYALSQSGNADDALKAFDKAIELNPQNSTTWKDKGVALSILKKYDEAIKALDKAIEINPHDLYAWGNKWLALGQLGKSDEAMKAYDKALEIDPQDSIALEGSVAKNPF